MKYLTHFLRNLWNPLSEGGDLLLLVVLDVQLWKHPLRHYYNLITMNTTSVGCQCDWENEIEDTFAGSRRVIMKILSFCVFLSIVLFVVNGISFRHHNHGLYSNPCHNQVVRTKMTPRKMLPSREIMALKMLSSKILPLKILLRRVRRSGTGYRMKCLPHHIKVCRMFTNGSVTKKLCVRRKIQRCTGLDW